MTVRTDRQGAPASEAELDCIAWVRSVRDAMYEATLNLPEDEFVSYVHRAAAAVDAGSGQIVGRTRSKGSAAEL